MGSLGPSRDPERRQQQERAEEEVALSRLPRTAGEVIDREEERSAEGGESPPRRDERGGDERRPGEPGQVEGAPSPVAGAEARALELLRFVKLDGLKHEYAGNLSYGQQKLVEFVRVLMRDPSLILLDEPAAGVNRTLLNDLLEAVRRLRDDGKTVLLVEHDMKVVMGLCETVFVLDHGEKIAEGPPGVIQADERVIEAYFGR